MKFSQKIIKVWNGSGKIRNPSAWRYPRGKIQLEEAKIWICRAVSQNSNPPMLREKKRDLEAIASEIVTFTLNQLRIISEPTHSHNWYYNTIQYT